MQEIGIRCPLPGSCNADSCRLQARAASRYGRLTYPQRFWGQCRPIRFSNAICQPTRPHPLRLGTRFLPTPSTGSGPIGGEYAKQQPVVSIRVECCNRRYHLWPTSLNSLGNSQHVHPLAGALQHSRLAACTTNRRAESARPKKRRKISAGAGEF